MRLNLGCGNDIRQGYTNVDFRKTNPVILEVDLSVFPWPFESSSTEEILMLDFLEHFPYRTTSTILLEVNRVLAPDGLVTIQVPDAVHTARALLQEGEYLCNRCGGDMGEDVDDCPKCGQTRDEISEAAMQRFYGGQDYPGNWHQTCFTGRSLIQKCTAAGLMWIEHSKDDDHYWRNWTLSMRFRKGDIW